MLIEIHNIQPRGLECDIEISIDVADEGIYMQNGYTEFFFSSDDIILVPPTLVAVLPIWTLR